MSGWKAFKAFMVSEEVQAVKQTAAVHMHTARQKVDHLVAELLLPDSPVPSPTYPEPKAGGGITRNSKARLYRKILGRTRPDGQVYSPRAIRAGGVMSPGRAGSTGGDGAPGALPLALILLYSGDVADLGRCCCVSRQWRDAIYPDRLLWKWCVRWGTVSPETRPVFWLRCAKCQQTPSNDLYRKLIQAGSDTRWVEDILVDVERSYEHMPDLRARGKELFDPSAPVPPVSEQRGGAEGTEQLKAASSVFRVLLATAAVDGSEDGVGYCQGMNFVATELVRTCSASSSFMARAGSSGMEESAFALFNSLLHEPYDLTEMYMPGMKRLQVRCLQFASLMKMFLPRLCLHFKEQRLVVEMFAIGWFQTLFLYLEAIPQESVRRVWDVFIFERNWKIIFRVALALLRLAEKDLLGKPLDQILLFITTYPDAEKVLEPRALLRTALDIKITSRLLAQLRRRWESSIRGSPQGEQAA